MPIKIFVFSEKGSQTEISLLHFPLQRKMKLGRPSPLALLSLRVIAVLQRLERRDAPLQPSSPSRHAAWHGFKIAGGPGRAHSRLPPSLARVCVPDAEGASGTRSAGPGGGWQSRGRDALQQPAGRGCWRLSPPAAEGVSDGPGIARRAEVGRLAGRLSGTAVDGGTVTPVPSTASRQVLVGGAVYGH